MRTMALPIFSLAWPYPEHASGQLVRWVEEKADDVPALSRVRSSNVSIAELIDRATAKSPTFKTLRARIDVSDGIVYVASGQCSHGVWACIQYLGAGAWSKSVPAHCGGPAQHFV